VVDGLLSKVSHSVARYFCLLSCTISIEYEIIDLLQGRVPKSVFARHYFNPSLEYRDKVSRALDNLKQQIDEG